MTTVSPSFGGASLTRLGPEIKGAPQFDRRVVVIIGGPPKPNVLDPTKNDVPTLVVNEKANDLRVKFKIQRPLIWTPNLGSIEVYGLSPASRAIIQQKNCRVALLAGYRSDVVQAGVLSAAQINHKHDAADWITKFEGGDGGRNFLNGRASASFAAGSPMSKAVESFGKILGKFGAGSMSTVQKAASGRSFKNGYAAHGQAVDEFRYLLKELGLEYCIVDEEIVVMPRNGTTQEVFVVTPDSGLIGSPEFASPPSPGKPQLLRVKMLLNPPLRPGALIILQSASHSGQFRCRDVTHTGDTHGGAWETEAELQPLKGAK